MNMTEFLEKWGRTVFEKPLAKTESMDSPPELAEIRFAILEEVRRKSYRAGARVVFPFDLVSVSMRGVEESRAAAFRSGFFQSYVAHEIQAKLRAESVRFPERLQVHVDVTTGLPLPNESWLTVAVTAQERPAGLGERARLMVKEGTANAQEISLDKPRLQIGRDFDVYRDGGMVRRNDLVFAEESDVNRTVSREHAHIDYDKTTGEYRLFNDRWYPRGADCGTRIVRDGLSIEVQRDSRGTKLEPADEIHLGRAVMIFQA